MAFGKPNVVENIRQELHKCLLLKDTGRINGGRYKACFLGRNLERSGDAIYIFGDKEY